MPAPQYQSYLGAAVALVGLCAATGALAQSMSTNSASYNGGYGRIQGMENRPIETYSNRDANGNLTIVNGLIQSASSYSALEGGDTYTGGGVGTQSASVSGQQSNTLNTAIGNQLSVVTQGNYNTVIVNSVQTNTGNISAGTK